MTVQNASARVGIAIILWIVMTDQMKMIAIEQLKSLPEAQRKDQHQLEILPKDRRKYRATHQIHLIRHQWAATLSTARKSIGKQQI
jgi:hypothetical protein